MHKIRNHKFETFRFLKLRFVSNFEFRISSFSRPTAGFTLIELLVVLVILIIITGVSMTTIPSFSSPRQKLRNDARELLTLLREARQTAMLRKMKVDVCVDPDRGSVRVIETAHARKLTVTGESIFDEDAVDTNVWFRTVSFDEDIELGIFPPEAVKTVLSDDDDPFSESPEWEPVEGDAVAFTFTTFGGASGGGISLIRDDSRLDIACDILTGEPEVVEVYGAAQ
jgi:prepilin-type N-terminal cleavage/methylation domain-containing protein